MLVSTQEGHRPVGTSSEEDHKDDPGGETPLLQGQAKGTGIVKPGKQKTSGGPYNCLPISEGNLQEELRGTVLEECPLVAHREMDLN